MDAALGRDVLERLALVALNLANNHSFDFGETGYEETRRAVEQLDVAALEHGRVSDIGPARVIALNFVAGGREGPSVNARAEVDRLCDADARGPLIVVPHWGREYTQAASEVENDLAKAMSSCAAALIVGGHSHRASARLTLPNLPTPMVFSLGNLMFDQTGDRVSSALLEVRFFKQGTLAARLIPLPNLFESAHKIAR